MSEEETPQEEPQQPEPPASEEEASAEEAPAEEAPAEEPPAEVVPAPPVEQLTPKAKRKLERSQARGPARPQRTPEERASERSQRRRSAAQSRRRYRATRRAKRGEPGTGTPPAEQATGARKVRLGTVVSARADKTITVRIETARRHPAYEKVVRRSRTVHAHDERNEAHEGDVVRVVETRPLSRSKRWLLLEILERAR